MTKKFKFIMMIALATVIAFAAVCVSADEVYESIKVDVNTINILVDGERVIADNFLYNDTTYVPLRCISEMFGKDVKYDETENAAYISDTDTPAEFEAKTDMPAEKSNQDIEVVRNSIKIYVNNALVESDNFVYNDTTYVPLRKISEMLAKEVTWEQLTNTAMIGEARKMYYEQGENAGEINGRPYTKEMMDLYKALYGEGELPEGLSADDAAIEQIKFDYAIFDFALENGIAAGVTFENQYQMSITGYESQYGVEEFDNLLKENGYDRESYRYVQTINYLYTEMLNAPQFAATDDEIRKFYDDNLDTYFNYDGRRAKHVLIMPEQDEEGNISDEAWDEALKKAKEVYDKAKKGEDFDSLIAEYNQDPGAEKYPDGYVFGRGEMVPEFEEACYSMKVGDISEPVKTSYGYHVIELEEEVKYMPFEDERTSIADYIVTTNVSAYLKSKTENVDSE